ncbi:aspartate aminotransferase family protein [Saccharopolyspora phatthalungensis]|uniref:Acetylornithine/succinyldiaminopimelate/putresci ne aminotransferase n=1 Tax=Saccharopolyspora phatthalungensis TaxID=664693 RepID=A0A840QB10_9PSEU|nr:aminotransferase class III-fold pyridoxal phosphate-dependent enzyme [Saccharopolyspora phatthalungensis]MBB5157137.1 acetylornithine/succinyldiaminopimelate/putrescine aminotransferase [Saccharopolyspora phatthalungensis]
MSITGRLIPAHPELLSVDEATRLGQDTVAEIYRQHISPGQWTAFGLLGFDRIAVDHAEDVYYVDRSGRRILDFFGGFGAMALGHNHPRVLEVRRRFQEQQRHELGLTLPSQYVAALSRNLATLAPDGLDRVMLYCTGSEAVEAALKLAERAQGPRRAKVAYACNSFHGKTIGALSVTDSEFYRGRFEVLPRRQAVPFGDAAALEDLLRRDRGIGVLILETVQGGAGVVLPPPGYLEQVRRLCDRYGVLWIADEVQCGVGRTGRFFAFEHAGVTPDIVTLAKALGGGKTAISAVLAGHEIHDRAYGGARNALVHGPATFSGMGEACCTAIETLHVLHDENLLTNAAEQGEHLLSGLRWLHRRHPKLIRDVRGSGLMAAVEFADLSGCLPGLPGRVAGVLDRPLRGSVAMLAGSQLLSEFGILVAFTDYNRNVVRLEPPLTIRPQHVDMLVGGFDDLLAQGLKGLAAGYLRRRYRSQITEPLTAAPAPASRSGTEVADQPRRS